MNRPGLREKVARVLVDFRPSRTATLDEGIRETADAVMRVIVDELRSPCGPHNPDHGYWAADYIERAWESATP